MKANNTAAPASLRPAKCGECTRFMRDPDNPTCGFCDNWAGVYLSENDVCHPNFGIKKVSRK